MPTQSPTIKVQVEIKRGMRRTFELTAAQEHALETVDNMGRVSDAVPFPTARSMVRKGLLAQVGPVWVITSLGYVVRSRVRAKRRAGR